MGARLAEAPAHPLYTDGRPLWKDASHHQAEGALMRPNGSFYNIKDQEARPRDPASAYALVNHEHPGVEISPGSVVMTDSIGAGSRVSNAWLSAGVQAGRSTQFDGGSGGCVAVGPNAQFGDHTQLLAEGKEMVIGEGVQFGRGVSVKGASTVVATHLANDTGVKDSQLLLSNVRPNPTIREGNVTITQSRIEACNIEPRGGDMTRLHRCELTRVNVTNADLVGVQRDGTNANGDTADFSHCRLVCADAAKGGRITFGSDVWVPPGAVYEGPGRDFKTKADWDGAIGRGEVGFDESLHAQSQAKITESAFERSRTIGEVLEGVNQRFKARTGREVGETGYRS